MKQGNEKALYGDRKAAGNGCIGVVKERGTVCVKAGLASKKGCEETRRRTTGAKQAQGKR